MKRIGNKPFIVIIILMIITVLGTLGYAKMKPKNSDEKSIKEPKKEITNDDSKVEPQEEIKYTNYTNANIEIKDKGTLSLDIKDGIFNMKFNNTILKLTGINEKIKSFTYDENAYIVARNNNGIIILLLSENNNIYVGFYEENDITLYFRKINTNLKIKDITINESLNMNKSSIKTSVVLENDEIRPIIESGYIYIISNKDTSKIEKVYDNIVIYKDGTISPKNNLNSKFKYKNQDMIINKILSVELNGENKCYYIIANKRLFKLCGKDKNQKPTNFNDIELVNNKVIIGTTNLNIGYTSQEMNYEIVYDDNSKDIIKILNAYIR